MYIVNTFIFGIFILWTVGYLESTDLYLYLHIIMLYLYSVITGITKCEGITLLSHVNFATESNGNRKNFSFDI